MEPQMNERVQIVHRDDHILPAVLEGHDLPIPECIAIEEAGGKDYPGVWKVAVPGVGMVYVHQEQLEPIPEEPLILVGRDMCEVCDQFVGRPHAPGCPRKPGIVQIDEAVEKMTTLAKVEEDFEQQLRGALDIIGSMGAPRGFEAEDPTVWAVAIVSAAVDSEAAGDARRQDELIEAVATVLRCPTGEGHGLTVEQMIMRVMGKG